MAESELVKVTIRLPRAHRDRLLELFPKAGYNVAIRTLVANLIKSIEERRNQTEQPKLEDINIDLDKQR